MLQRGIRVVSLFDGISCGRVALDRLGIPVSSYEAFEIDKYALAVSRYNYPNIIQHGDVLNADFKQFAGYELLIGGSPCTFWSVARNKREVDKDGVGWKLFMCFAEALRQIKPLFFLYENVVSMPTNIRMYISEALECEPILINSSLISAQQRKRFYWTNISCITQPKDRGILVKDILETSYAVHEKSYCMDASCYKGGSKSQLGIQRRKRQLVCKPITIANKSRAKSSHINKEPPLSMSKYEKAGLFYAHEDCDNGVALYSSVDNIGCFKQLEVRNDSKQNALASIQTDSVACTPIRVGTLGTGGQGNRIYSVHGKTIALMANGGGRGANVGLYKIEMPDGNYTVRKLVPIEAERCQTLPDNYTAFGTYDNGKTAKISNTQRYKCIGNGWTVDVIAHILSFAGFRFSA